MQFSAAGKLTKETPSMLTLEETEPDKTMALTLERMPTGEPKKVNNLTFTYPGPAPYTYFFESGAFSQGASQWSSFGQFVTEFSMKVGDRRIRFVIAYQGTPSYTSTINYVTLIGETQTGGTPFKAEALTLEQLMGTWKGSGERLASTTGNLEKGSLSQWQLDTAAGSQVSLRCEEQLGQVTHCVEFVRGEARDASSAEGKVVALKDEAAAIDYQLMLLPQSAYCLLPQEIRRDRNFRIEVGWLSENNERSRFIRYYDKRGVWTHSAQLTDTPHTEPLPD